MGANTFLKDVESYGYKVQADTDTAVIQNITGKSRGRIAIKAFGFTCGNIATSLYFMQVMGTSTVVGAHSSSVTTITFAGDSIGGTATGAVASVAANDYVAIQMDDGSYHFSKVAAMATSLVMTISTAIDDTCASGNTIWGLGAAGDQGQLEYLLTEKTQNTEAIDGGIFYANAKAYPMMLYHLNASATDLGSIDYLSVDYINS